MSRSVHPWVERDILEEMVFRVLLAMVLAFGLQAQQSQAPRKKRLLCIGAVKGFQHDATSHGLATLWKIGQETGLYY